MQDYLLVVRKRWRVILPVVLVCVGLASAATVAETKIYESSTQFFVSTTGSDDSAPCSRAHLHPATGEVYAAAAHHSAHPRPGRRPRSASPATSPARSPRRPRPTPCSSRSRCATTARSRPRRSPRRSPRSSPCGQRARDPARHRGEPGQGDRRAAARPPRSPRSARSRCATSLLGAVLGLLLGLGAALVRETLDKTVKTQDDVKAITDSPILGAIVRDPDAVKRPLIVEVDPRSPRAEAFRSLRTNLQFVDAANHPRTLRRHLVPGRRGQVDDVGQPRAHDGPGRLEGLPRRGRPAPPQGARLPGPRGRGGPHRRADRPRRGLRPDPALRRHEPVGARRAGRSRRTRPSCWAPRRCAACSPTWRRASTTSSSTPRPPCRSRMPWCSRAWSTA